MRDLSIMPRETEVTDDQVVATRSGTVDHAPSPDECEQLALSMACDHPFPTRWDAARDHWGTDTAIELPWVFAWWGSFIPTPIEATGIEHP
jgi:hypothetical protein